MKSLVILILTLITTSASANYCATVYDGENFTGHHKEIGNFVDITNLNYHFMPDDRDWDNKISSVHIADNCTLTVYQYQNYGRDFETGRRIGFEYSLENEGNINTYSNLGDADNKISSLTCECR